MWGRCHEYGDGRFTGPRAEYLRPGGGSVRTQSHLLAEPRSNIWVSPQDAGESSGKDSVNVQANRIVMDKFDSLIYAKGLVVIERPDLLSTSDSAFVGQVHGVRPPHADAEGRRTR